MKKATLLFIAIFLAVNIFAQANNKIYVLFSNNTNINNAEYGVCHDEDRIEAISQHKTTTAHYFFLFSNIPEKKYLLGFVSLYRKTDPDIPVLSVDLEFFLNHYTYIDWDVVGPTLTRDQAEAKYKQICSYKQIYFVDRKDLLGGKVRMFPVKQIVLPEL